ncbi:MFS transporter [Virgibacillus profundi]|uniref:MFS transporter n=1 Tax=Virgibacillus profundi TaxID=2024555 RepID=A0A2A2IGV3_9BACI|nr:MFS transporter [Virgibacillus profundi]PAV30989.1 MFS transporter [Virgibacillus profundi]PXY55174.1 MFS transporter [Virgibacillus profundi]
MGLQNASDRSKEIHRFLLIAGIIVVAFNLRPSITSVGPLLGIIRDDVGLSNWSVGILTSLPLIAFAIMSPIVPRLGNRFSNERVMLLGLILLLFGISIRSISLIFFLFLGTLFVGLGIAICNVLLPGVIKGKFPAKVAIMTSIYSTSMGIFAATASGLSIPIATGLGLGWQLALVVWVTPAVIGIIIWIYIIKKDSTDAAHVKAGYYKSSDNRIWKSPLAWQVAAFMGLQSFLFYVTISWLPEILLRFGVSLTTAGWMLSFMQFIGLPASFLVPMIADKFKSQRGIVLVLGALFISGYGGLLLGNSFTVMVISTILLGFTLSGAFALALTFLGMRARNARQAAELSGMAQAFGYVLAATGPMFIGYLYDVTHVWTVPLLTMIGVALLVVLFGMGAGRDKYVLE